jgi:hypothetical protein
LAGGWKMQANTRRSDQKLGGTAEAMYEKKFQI